MKPSSSTTAILKPYVLRLRLFPSFLAATIFFVATIQCCESLETGTPHSTVIDLDGSNFDEAINDPANGLWFLKFYAPWCGHCKKLAPTLDAMAPYLSGKMSIGKIDCTSDKQLCKRFDVKGYPTLKIYRDGDFFDYPGRRDADSMIDFAEKMSVPAVTLVRSHEEAMQEVVRKNVEGVGFVAYDSMASVSGEGGGAEEAELEGLLASTTSLQVFGQIARKMQAYGSFGLLHPSTPLSELKKFGVDTTDNNGGKGLLMKVEEEVDTRVYDGELSSPFFLDFVKENNVALITSLDAHNFHSTGKKGKPLVITVVNPNDAVKTSAILDVLKNYAKDGPEDIKGKYFFCQINGMKWFGFLKQFSISMDRLPEIFVLDVPKRTYWKSDSESYGELSSELAMSKFMEDVASGKIQPQYQSGGGAENGILAPIQRILNRYMPYSLIAVFVFFGIIFYFALSVDGDDEIAYVQQSKKSEQTKKED